MNTSIPQVKTAAVQQVFFILYDLGAGANVVQKNFQGLQGGSCSVDLAPNSCDKSSKAGSEHLQEGKNQEDSEGNEPSARQARPEDSPPTA